MRKSLVVLVAAWLCASGTGCRAHHVSRGSDLYAGGHLIEAAEVFERTEPRLGTSSALQRARYGLYRGATLLALGDLLQADHWLTYASAIEKSEPGVLSGEELEMLERTFGTLSSRRPGGSGLPFEGSALAASRSVDLAGAAEPSEDASGSRN